MRAACVAKAPTRTIAAAAAAAISAPLRLDDAAVAPPMPVPEQSARLSSPDGQEDTASVQQLRQRRAERRRTKRTTGGKLLRLRWHPLEKMHR